MPQDNIDRAIKKAAGELEGVSYVELNYEGYGPAGVAILVESVTDNKNRTVADLRHVFNKYGGSLGETGSVAWMFDRKGQITLPNQGKTEEEIFELILEEGAEDLQTEEDFYQVITSLESFESVRKTLIEKNVQIENAALEWIAKNNILLKGEDAEKVIKLIEALEDCDDVQNVYSNADFVDV